MRAMVLRGKQLGIEERPVPEPGPGQVLARVLACGICGSDLHAARFMEEMAAAVRAQRRSAWYAVQSLEGGLVMGHEFVAEVMRAGEGVDGWAPGTRVTGVPVLLVPDAHPPFRSIGFSPEIPGAYSEYVLMSASMLLRVPDHVPDDVAATTEPCAVGLHAVREARMQPHETALVIGAGPIGLMTLLWLKHDRVPFVAVTDLSAERRDLAAKLGADLVLDPRATDVAAALQAALKGPAAPVVPTSYGGEALTAAPEVVFECVGVPGMIEQAMELVQARGRVIVAGVCMNEDRFRPLIGINKTLTLQFVLGYSAAEYAETLAAFGEGRIDPAPLITRRVGLDELPAQFVALANPRDCKVLFVNR